MRSVPTAAAAALLLALLAGCVPQRGENAGPAHLAPIIVRDFAVSPGLVTLDPSFGFSLYRGAPGVPPRQRAASVGRAAAFSLADAIVQQVAAHGYDAIHSDAATAAPGGRALIVGGAFHGIYEGHRRQNASIAVDAEIDYQQAAAAPLRLMAFPVDSRRLPRRRAAPAMPKHGTDVNFAAAQVGKAIADTVINLARLNHWPAAPR